MGKKMDKFHYPGGKVVGTNLGKIGPEGHVDLNQESSHLSNSFCDVKKPVGKSS